ncbi:MAG: hypothetical protein DSY77_02820 [Bacteroidetes bacterium]|nr:MAG: hypothetical protein DSY77_02820 [Bacteroidota bacterium]
MKSHLKYLLPLLTFILIASSCQKEEIEVEDELPPITQEGLNTFGCKIDGEVFVPKDGEPSFFVSAATGLRVVFGTDFQADSGGDDVSISAVNAKDENGNFVFIYIDSISSENIFEIFDSEGSSVNPQINSHGFVVTYSNGQRKKFLSFSNAGKIDVTLIDFESYIISGIFEFQAVNEADYTDTLSITEGRFDINWRTLNEEE